MTLAIVESWSFEVPRLIEFVIWGIEISCFFFFFFRDDYAQLEIFWRRKRYRWIWKRKFPRRFIRVSLFSVSLSYLFSMETFYKEKIIEIFSRTRNSSSRSIVDFLFKLVIVSSLSYLFFVESFVPLLSNNSRNNLSLSLQKCNCTEWNIVKEFSLQLSTPVIYRILFFV